MKYVTVNFERGGFKPYHYLCEDDEVNVGDYYIVHPKDFPSVVEIVTVSNVPSTKATKLLGQKVCTEVYDAGMERLKRKKELHSILKAKKKAFEETAIYEMLSEKDGEVAKILEELKSL